MRVFIVMLGVLCLPFLSGCWPGRCDGALRGTFRVQFISDLHAPCDAGPECAEIITPDQAFRQGGDFRRVEDTEELFESSGMSTEIWFLVDESDERLPATLSAIQHESAHSCASAIGFRLQPDDLLEPGIYRLVLLTDHVAWPIVVTQGIKPTVFEDEPAIVQYYRVPSETDAAE